MIYKRTLSTKNMAKFILYYLNKTDRILKMNWNDLGYFRSCF
jgi:hypothetical protein